ncbi:MAG TPA: hypothetical protein DIW23_12365 [Anaerolineae bacterium]|nr:hypothetical protein [Anaerolineae bacterium]
MNLFRLNQNDPVYLPPYVEFVKIWDRAKKNQELVNASIQILKKQLTFIPNKNPFETFIKRLAKDMDWLNQESLDMFHQYSFVTLRQLGACYELSKTYLQWLQQNGEKNLDDVIEIFNNISTTAKTTQFQLARAVSKKKPLDFSPIEKMGQDWQTAMNTLQKLYL